RRAAVRSGCFPTAAPRRSSRTARRTPPPHARTAAPWSLLRGVLRSGARRRSQDEDAEPVLGRVGLFGDGFPTDRLGDAVAEREPAELIDDGERARERRL